MIVLEHKNEVVDLIDARGKSQRFFPEVDLEASLQLLIQFNNAMEHGGKKLYELWDYKGYYFYPAVQEWLYWMFFMPLVKHQKAWQAIRGHQVDFQEVHSSCMRGLWTLHHILYHRWSWSRRAVYNVCMHLLRCLSKPEHDCIVYDDGKEGFRYQKFKETLAEQTPFSRYELPRSYAQLWRLFRQRDHLVGGYKALTYPKVPVVDYHACPFLHPYLTQDEFQLLLQAVHRRCCDKVAEARVLERYIGRLNLKMLCGYDQLEDALGLVVACRLKGVPVVTYQHGLFTRYHAGWIAPGIPKRFCNIIADKLVVWGEYWRDKLVKYSNKYDAHNTVVGSHIRHNMEWKPKKGTRMGEPLTVLLPFEFLTNQVAVSRYIRKFLALKWKVMIKIRPSGSGDPQTDCFAFDPDVRHQVIYQSHLTPEEIGAIDVVACTQSTLAFEFMSYHKPIWYLKSNFQFLEIVEDGFAHLITEEILDQMQDKHILSPYLQPLYSAHQVKQLFSQTKLNLMECKCSVPLEDSGDRTL